MLPFFLIPMLLAWARHFSLRPMLRAWDLYPLFAVELLHLFFQINGWFGNYTFVVFAQPLQTAFLLVLLVPILRRKLYKPALCSAGCVVVGSVLNRVVMAANSGTMPVLPTLSQWTGYCTTQTLSSGVDSLHVLMTQATKLNFLGDYLDLGWCILSPGDVLVHLSVAIILYQSIRTPIVSKESTKNQK